MYGTFVRAVRDARGLTRRQLAAVSGVAPSTISAIERGCRTPSAGTLNRLIVACGFELAAAAGSRVVYCGEPASPVQRAGWFPGEDLPARQPGDPADEAPVIGADASTEERLAVIEALLGAVGATRP